VRSIGTGNFGMNRGGDELAREEFANQPPNFYALSSLNTGNAVGIFNDQSPAASEAINENSLYYSFDLKAIAPGSGNILFDSTPGANQYAADDTGFNFAPLPTGGPLAFTIASVPEPASLTLGLVATLVGLGYAGSRRRRNPISPGRAPR
jgi:hypothetical protein